MQQETVLQSYFKVVDVAKREVLACLERIELPPEELEKVKVGFLLDQMMLQSKIFEFVEDNKEHIEKKNRNELVKLLAPNLLPFVSRVSDLEWQRGFLFAKTFLSLLNDLKRAQE
jgi:hypothetical protein